MKKTSLLSLFTAGCLLWSMGAPFPACAQDDTILLAHETSFGKLQRPPVRFPHERHVEAMEEAGCGSCHHVYSVEEQRLVPADGEETGCMDCHRSPNKKNVPTLRRAYHGSCTVCHRSAKNEGRPSGPTTCGECHASHETSSAHR